MHHLASLLPLLVAAFPGRAVGSPLSANQNRISSSATASSDVVATSASSAISSVTESPLVAPVVANLRISTSKKTTTTTSAKTTKKTSVKTSAKTAANKVAKTTSTKAAAKTTKKTTNNKAQPTAKTGSGKRGVAFNDPEYTKLFGHANSQVTWSYNWYLSACGDLSYDCAYNTGLDYVPLLFSNDTSVTSKWKAAADFAIANGSPALFSFNEPDVCWPGSACMTVASAVKTYKKFMQPYAGKALLGAPAVTNAGSPAGITWLGKFLKQCPTCHVDFVNVHFYTNIYAVQTLAYFQSFINDVRKVANGRPIWVTEYGVNDENAYTSAQLNDFLKRSMAWMDQQDDIAKYSYFYAAPGILVGKAGKALSPTGKVFDTYRNTTKQPDFY